MQRLADPEHDLDDFISACRAALSEDPPQRAIREVMARWLSVPARPSRSLAEPSRAQIQKLHHAPDLTILHVVWAPNMCIMPHDHHMWAVIGILDGREDNIFWRRTKDAATGAIEAAGARALGAGECVTLGHDIIHSVINPIPRHTSAIHVYGGDFFATQRSEWDPETLAEQPYSAEKVVRMFEDANRRLAVN